MQSPPNQSKPKSISRRVFLKMLAALPFTKTLPERSSKQKPIAEGGVTNSKLVFGVDSGSDDLTSIVAAIRDADGDVFVKDVFYFHNTEWNLTPDEKRLAAVRAMLKEGPVYCNWEFYPIFGECTRCWCVQVRMIEAIDIKPFRE